MVDVKTESQHAAEFLLSEGPGDISREQGTLLQGQVVRDGTVLSVSGAGVIASADGSDPVGIVIGNHDATDGAKEVAYIARNATVRVGAVYIGDTSSDSDSEPDAVSDWAALRALNIIPRDTVDSWHSVNTGPESESI